MAADMQGTAEIVEADAEERRPRRASTVSFDERLMPTCMIVSMVVGLGLMVAIALYWGISNFDSITR